MDQWMHTCTWVHILYTVHWPDSQLLDIRSVASQLSAISNLDSVLNNGSVAIYAVFSEPTVSSWTVSMQGTRFGLQEGYAYATLGLNS